MLRHAAFIVLLGAVGYGCGDSDSKSSFTECTVRERDCRGGTCVETELCEVDECKTDVDYFFDETEYETKCTFGDTRTTLEYPLDGGPGRRETRRDVEECFYETEFDGNDIDEEGRCERVRDCTVDVLDCDDSEPGDPDCRVIDSQPCADEAAVS